MVWRFHIAQGNLPDRQVPIVAGAKLGRQADCAVLLEDGMISRQHAEVIERHGALVLKDLGSANGLIVDGRLLREVVLAPGMVIELPPFTLTVQEQRELENSKIQAPKSLDDLLDAEPVAAQPAAETTEIDGNQSAQSSTTTNRPPHASSAPLPNQTVLLAMPMAPRLMPLNFKLEQAQWQLTHPLLTVGRGAEAELRIAHASVSSQHAQLRRHDDRIQVIDLQSTNGTRVNGDLIRQCLLQCHDIVEFGDIKFEFLEGPALPQARSHNVIEVMDDPQLDGVTRRPPTARQVANFAWRPASLALGGLALILLALPMIHQQRQDRQSPTTALASLSVAAPGSQSEGQRIIAHQLTQARRLINEGKYTEAKVKVDLILEKLDTNNLEARTMSEEIARVTSEQQRLAALQEARLLAAKDSLRQWMTQGGAAFDQQRYSEAREYYRQVLAIQPDHQAALQQLSRIESTLAAIAERNRRGVEMQAAIAETYTQGIVAYNAGNLLEAAKLLREVITYPKHPNYDEARIALTDVEEKLIVEVEEKVREANSLYIKGYLSEARDIIREARAGNQKHEAAKSLEQKILVEIRERAKQLFREGYTFENLVQDYLSAKERYQKVLELLPDKSEEYHQKASARLKSLES